MDLYSAISQRRTIRDFQDKEVPMEIIQKILNAGLKAPTNDHLRNWEFVVLTDKEEKARIISKIPKTYTKKAVEDFMDSYHMTDSCQRAMYMDGVPKQIYNAIQLRSSHSPLLPAGLPFVETGLNQFF
jgi:nitroreductase